VTSAARAISAAGPSLAAVARQSTLTPGSGTISYVQ